MAEQPLEASGSPSHGGSRSIKLSETEGLVERSPVPRRMATRVKPDTTGPWEAVSLKPSVARIGGREPQRPGLSGQAYSFVKGLLLDGVFSPDDLIPVERIATEIKTSRQPVLDGLKRLEVEGFVVITPQVGCRARAYPSQEIQDFYRLFALGESLICELAAERSTKQEIASMNAISTRIGKLRVSKGNGVKIGRDYRTLNRELHYLIRLSARSNCMTEVVERMGDQSDFFVATSGATLFADRLMSAHNEHEAILAAIAERRPKDAGDVMSEHILAIASRIKNQADLSPA